jgi:predicted phage terminase large subunit-like protein
LLCPERFSREYLENDFKPTLRSWGGEYAIAGQLAQRPQPRGGGMFQRSDFQIIELSEVPEGGETVRGWDLAATKDGRAAYTAGVKMKKGPRGGIYILDVRRDRLSPLAVEKLIKDCADSDGPNVLQSLPQDPGQAGKAQKAAYASGALAGANFRFSPESGSKEDRARPFAAQCEARNVFLVRANWNEPFITECTSFPTGAFKDQVDGASRAYGELVSVKRRGGAGKPVAIPL